LFAAVRGIVTTYQCRRFGVVLLLTATLCATASADSGSIRLTDSEHLSYSILKEVGDPGAVSEASFIDFVTVSTAMGGTAAERPDDMFDGALVLRVSLESLTTVDGDWMSYVTASPASSNADCLAGGGNAPTHSTLRGEPFETPGFTSDMDLVLVIDGETTVVAVGAADRTPAQVAAKINAALGRNVASVVGDAIVLSVLGATPLEAYGAAAAGIGFSAPVYAPGAGSRELIYPAVNFGSALRVERRVYVPEDDAFLRSIERFTNTGSEPISFTVQIHSNLGSDSGTTIWGSSSGDAVAGLDDAWVGSFQAFSGPISPDPRIAFVLSNPASAVRQSAVKYENGFGYAIWIYSLTLEPGETKAIMGYVIGSGTKAGAQALAESLVDPRGRPAALRCITPAQRAEIVNLPAVPCAFAAETTCDDGNAETTDDHCTGPGICAGTPVPKDAGVPADAQTESDAAVEADATDVAPPSPAHGGGCAATGTPATGGAASLALCVFALCLLRGSRVRAAGRRT
jgi:hypothetical protein